MTEINTLPPSRFVLTLLAILFFIGLHGQTTDSIPVVQRSEEYSLSSTCKDVIRWDEVVLNDKAVENKINSAIRKEVMTHKLSPDDADERCNNKMEYDAEANVVFDSHNLISYYFTTFSFYENAAHGWRTFKTMNFNTKDGNLIGFHDFIDSAKIPDIDSMIFRKFKIRLNVFDEEYLGNFKNQLRDPEFQITKSGVDILFRGENYITSIIDVSLSVEEFWSSLSNNELGKMLKACYPLYMASKYQEQGATQKTPVQVKSKYPFGCKSLTAFNYPKNWESIPGTDGALKMPEGKELDNIQECFENLNSGKTISPPKVNKIELIRIGDNYSDNMYLDTLLQKSMDSCRYHLPNMKPYQCYYAFINDTKPNSFGMYGNLLLLDPKTGNGKLLNIYFEGSGDAHVEFRFFLMGTDNTIRIYEGSCYDDGCFLDLKYLVSIEQSGEIKIREIKK